MLDELKTKFLSSNSLQRKSLEFLPALGKTCLHQCGVREGIQDLLTLFQLPTTYSRDIWSYRFLDLFRILHGIPGCFSAFSIAVSEFDYIRLAELVNHPSALWVLKYCCFFFLVLPFLVSGNFTVSSGNFKGSKVGCLRLIYQLKPYQAIDL